MEKAGVNKQIVEFNLRNKKNFSINNMSAIEIDELVEFNKTVYKEEFNAARFSDRERILKIWNWKYENNPASKNLINFGWLTSYKKKLNIMKGFAVVREGKIKSGRLKGKKIGIISDILINPQERKCTATLLKAITEFFRNKKALLIKCDILNKQIRRALLMTGFIVTRSKNAFMLNLYDHNLSQEALHLASNRKNWFITSGDSDFDFD